jgi:predicted PurR-regulated permease PerM
MLFRIAFPFIFATLIAYLITPGVEYFEKIGMKRLSAIIFVYILLLTLSITSTVILAPQVIANINELTQTLPEIASMYNDKVSIIFEFIVESGLPPDMRNTLYNEMLRGVQSFEHLTLQYVKNIFLKSFSMFPLILGTFVAFIISFYLLKDISLFKTFIFSLSPSKYRNDISIIGKEIHHVLKGFIQGQLLISFIVGLLEIIGLTMIGVNFPFFLGVIGGIANIIPYFGPLLGALPAIFIALSQSGTKALLTILVFVVVQQIENAIISPRIIEGKLGLHPVTTIFIVLIGGELFGIKGMILSVPIFAISKIIFRRMIEKFV